MKPPIPPPHTFSASGARTTKILRRLLVGRLECEPFDDGERRGYRITGEGSYAGILPASIAPQYVVTPGGYSSPWAFHFETMAIAS